MGIKKEENKIEKILEEVYKQMDIREAQQKEKEKEKLKVLLQYYREDLENFSFETFRDYENLSPFEDDRFIPMYLFNFFMHKELLNESQKEEYFKLNYQMCKKTALLNPKTYNEYKIKKILIDECNELKRYNHIFIYKIDKKLYKLRSVFHLKILMRNIAKLREGYLVIDKYNRYYKLYKKSRIKTYREIKCINKLFYVDVIELEDKSTKNENTTVEIIDVEVL